eukprot:Nk52_evm17s554 gene=Nk52_evmTU17s554
MNKTMGMYFLKKIELQELAFKERGVRNKDIENENVVAQRIRVFRGALSDLREERDVCNSEGCGEYDPERSKSLSDQIRSINGKISKLAQQSLWCWELTGKLDILLQFARAKTVTSVLNSVHWKGEDSVQKHFDEELEKWNVEMLQGRTPIRKWVDVCRQGNFNRDYLRAFNCAASMSTMTKWLK